VWDLRTGDLVVLTDDKLVGEGWHGAALLSAEQLDEYHVAAPGSHSRATELFESLERFQADSVDAMSFPTHFEAPATQVIVAMVELSAIATRCDASAIQQLKADLGAAFEAAFFWKHFEADSGLYMRSIRRSPSDYIEDRVADGTRLWLEGLKAQNKRLFVLTNSNDDYAALIMETAFGADWRDLFDLVLCRANKRRAFFAEHPDPPLFLQTDGPSVATLDKSSGKEFLSGHVSGIEELIASEWGCSNVLFFGDHLEADIHLARTGAKWTVCAVAEELENPSHVAQLCSCANGSKKTQFWGQHERHAHSTVGDVKNKKSALGSKV
jgi:FMN phosphatase YigB (HAD superfamily)